MSLSRQRQPREKLGNDFFFFCARLKVVELLRNALEMQYDSY